MRCAGTLALATLCVLACLHGCHGDKEAGSYCSTGNGKCVCVAGDAAETRCKAVQKQFNAIPGRCNNLRYDNCQHDAYCKWSTSRRNDGKCMIDTCALATLTVMVACPKMWSGHDWLTWKASDKGKKFPSAECGETCEDDFNDWYTGQCSEQFAKPWMAARDKLNNNTAMAKDFESYAAKCEEAKPTLAIWMVVAIVVAGLIIMGSMIFLFVQESKSGAAKAEIDMNEVSRIHKESLAEAKEAKGGVEYGTNDNMNTAATGLTHSRMQQLDLSRNRKDDDGLTDGKRKKGQKANAKTRVDANQSWHAAKDTISTANRLEQDVQADGGGDI